MELLSVGKLRLYSQEAIDRAIKSHTPKLNLGTIYGQPQVCILNQVTMITSKLIGDVNNTNSPVEMPTYGSVDLLRRDLCTHTHIGGEFHPDHDGDSLLYRKLPKPHSDWVCSRPIGGGYSYLVKVLFNLKESGL